MKRPSVYWHTREEVQPLPTILVDHTTDVVVVGGGVAGLHCANRLADAGAEVTLLERDHCGSGASGLSSGFVTPDSEIELHALLSTYGPEEAKQIWDVARGGVSLLHETIEKHHLSCALERQDSLFVACKRSGFEQVTKEHQAHQRLGYVSHLYTKETLGDVLNAPYEGGVRYGETFSMNPFRYCLGLRDALRERGVRIFEGSPVVHLQADGVDTPLARVHATQTIVCTDRFLPELGPFSRLVYHVQTFLGITPPLSQEDVQCIFPAGPCMVWDTDLIYHYFRLTPDRRLLVGGGDLRSTYARRPSDDVEGVELRLLAYARRALTSPSLRFDHVWAGMLGVSKDLLPLMGPDAKWPQTFYVGARLASRGPPRSETMRRSAWHMAGEISTSVFRRTVAFP